MFFVYKFWKSSVYFDEKEYICGSSSSAPRNLNFCMVVYIYKRNGIGFAANSSQKLLHLGPLSGHGQGPLTPDLSTVEFFECCRPSLTEPRHSQWRSFTAGAKG